MLMGSLGELHLGLVEIFMVADFMTVDPYDPSTSSHRLLQHSRVLQIYYGLLLLVLLFTIACSGLLYCATTMWCYITTCYVSHNTVFVLLSLQVLYTVDEALQASSQGVTYCIMYVCMYVCMYVYA